MANPFVPYGSTINNTATIPAVAAEELKAARGKAVKFDEESGKAKLCDKAGDVAVGIVIYQGRSDIAQDEEFSVQIKEIGMAVAGGAVKPGQYVATDDQGRLVKATSGFCVGMAVTEATAEDELFYVQITKTGPVSAE